MIPARGPKQCFLQAFGAGKSKPGLDERADTCESRNPSLSAAGALGQAKLGQSKQGKNWHRNPSLCVAGALGHLEILKSRSISC